MFWKTQTISAISSLIFLCQVLVQKRLKQILPKYRTTATDGQLLGSDKNCTGGD